jgi:hypothetical protein
MLISYLLAIARGFGCAAPLAKTGCKEKTKTDTWHFAQGRLTRLAAHNDGGLVTAPSKSIVEKGIQFWASCITIGNLL